MTGRRSGTAVGLPGTRGPVAAAAGVTEGGACARYIRAPRPILPPFARPPSRAMAVPKPLIVVDPEIMGGQPVFAGTRVPVRFLEEHVAAGADLAEFLRDYPGVTRAQLVAVLAAGTQALIDRARAAGPLRPRAVRSVARRTRGEDRPSGRVGGAR